MNKLEEPFRSQTLTAASIKKNSPDSEIQVAYGLVQILTDWIRAQHVAETRMKICLTDEQKTFLQRDNRKNGCNLPPATKLAPKTSVFTFNPDDLDDSSLERIEYCYKIVQKSSHPWAAQNTSPIAQHLRGIVVGLLALANDTKIYAKYLGEQTIWVLFKQILDIIRKLCPSYMPWHEISADEDRADNAHQVVPVQTVEGHEIAPIAGAGMADQISTINRRYQLGLQKIWDTIIETAAYQHDGLNYIGDDIQTQAHQLFLVSG